jgi:hypothetical protein
MRRLHLGGDSSHQSGLMTHHRSRKGEGPLD